MTRSSFSQRRRGYIARFILAIVAAALIAACATPGIAGPVQITLLHDTHLHGSFGTDSLSLAHYAALANRIRSQKPNAFFLGNGDDLATSLDSPLFRGRHMVDALNAAGLDFDTYGNHDFDYGPENLLEQVASSEFTWVSANVIDRRTGDVFGAEVGARRYAVVEVAGVKIGFTGISPADTAELTKTGEHVVIVDPAEALLALVPEIRKEASVVVVLSHESWPQTERIAAIVPGVDVYVGDHAGQMIPQPNVIGGAIVSRVGDELDYLGELTLTIDNGVIVDWTFTLHDVRALIESGSLYPDVRVQRVIDRYTREADEALSEPVGVTRTPLDSRRVNVRTQETALGSFIADALRDSTGADFAIINSGSLRGDAVFGPGTLKRSDIVTILPFVNYAVKLRLKGESIIEALEHGVSAVESEHGRFPQVSGLAFTFDPSRPPGQRIVEVRAGDGPIDPDAWYTVATNDFLARGGDGYTMFVGAEQLIPAEAGGLLASVVIEAVEESGEIAPEIEGRITVVR